MDSYGKDLVKGIAFVVAFGFIVWFIVILLYMGFGPSQEQLAKDRSMQVIQEMDGCKPCRNSHPSFCVLLHWRHI